MPSRIVTSSTKVSGHLFALYRRSNLTYKAWEPRDPFRLTYELLLGQGGELQSEGTLDIFWTRL